MEKIALLFPGQGSQYVGMGKSFYDQYSIAKQTYEEASDVAGVDLAKLCFEGSLSELNQNENMQPALLATNVAAFRVYMEEVGIRPQFCAGHSMGEYSALVCSGAMTFSDAVQITKLRGAMMQIHIDRGTGSMTIMDGIDASIVEQLCEQYSGEQGVAVVSCYNSPTQAAVSGHQYVLEEIEAAVLDADGQVTPLMSSAPIHSSLMAEDAERLGQELAKYSYNMFKWPVLSNVTGQPYGDVERIPGLLTDQMVKPVQWTRILQYLERFGVTLAIEMGPKNVLNKLTKTNCPDINSLCFGEKAERQKLISMFQSDGKKKKGVPTVITKCLAIAVATPNQNWDEAEYQQGVVQRYKRIQAIQEQVENAGDKPSKEQMIEALELLKGIFETKKLPVKERNQWMNHIIDDTGHHYELAEYLVHEAVGVK
ncbi:MULTISPECIES: ACP S-malonyltransferase [unclassified Paenibacillus]|uniref:ACP S-malonyltransferase n=1 Tax=unclassified Paenibacillus TaxID=185978 RepID=UPI000CFCA8EC|nr:MULTISPECIES: ACP S-malonyltransferase [unclassified Paenibacillus]PRA00628.1 [acyl-carrier-protein] S-malonyltransferase [Paenibacillus sp. MYb63]PRA49836.1 [acyl-carrier-protein] S-malonyltransferase [Paenibacillus sp. MYb67]QZN75753.1 ACP S-malonyltransferase [Paenibacillus sp. DR312]